MLMLLLMLIVFTFANDVTPNDATLPSTVMVIDLVVLVEGDVGAGARRKHLALAADDSVAGNRRLDRRFGPNSKRRIADGLELEEIGIEFYDFFWGCLSLNLSFI